MFEKSKLLGIQTNYIGFEKYRLLLKVIEIKVV